MGHFWPLIHSSVGSRGYGSQLSAGSRNLGNAGTLGPRKQAGQAASLGISAGEAAQGESGGDPALHQALPALGTTAAGWSHPEDGAAAVLSVQGDCGKGDGCTLYTEVIGAPLAQGRGTAATSTSSVLSEVSSSAK